MTSKQGTILTYIKTLFEANAVIYHETDKDKINKINKDVVPFEEKHNSIQLFFGPNSGDGRAQSVGENEYDQVITCLLEFKRFTNENEDIYLITEAIMDAIRADQGLGGNVRNAIAIPIGYTTSEDNAVDGAIMIIRTRYSR